MEIFTVESTLVCTQRVSGLQHVSLRVLRDARGKRQVATDPVGARVGNWVFTMNGSAARWAMGDFSVLTDLTIGGIIDFWPDESAPRATASAAPGQADNGSTKDSVGRRHEDG